jgi:hypothetical protein
MSELISKIDFIMGPGGLERKGISLLQGSQALPARPSFKSWMTMKTLVLLEAVA